MPELPDVTVYLEALAARVRGRKLLGVRLASPFVLRTFDPPLSAAAGKKVLGLRRVGKRLVLELEGDLFLVMHLMIAGRLKWLDAGAKIPGKVGLAAFDFDSGTVVLTEVASKKRASIHLVRGEEAVREMDRGGTEPLEATLESFREGMAVHGRYRMPCPVCGTAVQRIAYAENETNYCPRCQTEGRVLSDRSLSRLLKEDWPRTVEELEERFGKRS